MSESAEAYNSRFDPANEAGQEIFEAAYRLGWMSSRFPDGWDDDDEEEYRRAVDGVETGEAWDAHRDAFFARLPLAAVEPPGENWHPIATAPKATTTDLQRHHYLMCWCPDASARFDGGDVRMCWWEPLMNKGRGCWWGDRDLPESPTHWMPQPEAPQADRAHG